MAIRSFLIVSVIIIADSEVAADDTIYRYEGDVMPFEKTPGWIIADPCAAACTESIENANFVLRWAKQEAGNLTNYTLFIATPETPPPPNTLWVEWRIRSNHAIPLAFYTCDASFMVQYGAIHEVVLMYGDAAVSFSGADFVLGLELNSFHTYRFESLDGQNYRVSVNGQVFIDSVSDHSFELHAISMRGNGGCVSDWFPNMVNEWDFVRYGTISSGEKIIASDPAAGFLDPEQHAGLDRFTVTFDSANYVYVDDITVEVTNGSPPIVIQTGRRENTEPDTVEIVLDRPLAMGETTRFTFDDGATVNVIEFTFAKGDTNGDGLVDLRDVAEFQNCFRRTTYLPTCAALDLVNDGVIRLDDLTPLTNELTGP